MTTQALRVHLIIIFSSSIHLQKTGARQSVKTVKQSCALTPEHNSEATKAIPARRV
jgi:hypothetical protein